MKTPTTTPISIAIPDDSTMVSTHTGQLDWPTLQALPPQARQVHFFPTMGNYSLLSIGQLTDAGCEATFTKDQLIVTYHDRPVLTGTRSTTTNSLWHVDPPAISLAAINQSAKPADIVAFAHAAFFSPAPTTLLKAIQRGYVTGVPGLTEKLFKKYTPNSVATAKGHLNQERKNKQSTKARKKKTPNKAKPDLSEDEETKTTFPSPLDDGKKTHQCFATVIKPQGNTY